MIFTMTTEGAVDARGRQRFTLEWEETDGVFRPELDKDGQPVGYRRGQMFFADPDLHEAQLSVRGHTVVRR